MKNGVSLVKAVLLIFTLGLCAVFSQNTGKEKVFKAENYQIEFTFPGNWRLSETKNPYDLQCTDGNANVSVFGFTREDLAQNRVPLDIFKAQVENLMSKRINVKKLGELKTVERKHATIYSELYSAEKDGSKNYYYCILVEFKGAPQNFAWVLCNSIPSYAKNSITLWNKIAESARQSPN